MRLLFSKKLTPSEQQAWEYLKNIIKPSSKLPCPTDPVIFKDFRRLLKAHRLTGWYYLEYLKKNNLFIPKKIQADFKAHTHHILKQVALRHRITQLLNQNNIRVLHLKGEVLSLALYNNPFTRVSRDIDILIHPEDVPLAHKILNNSHFSRTYPTKIHDSDLQNPKKLKKILNKYKDLVYQNTDTHITLELHWRLHIEHDWIAIPFDQLWLNRTAIQYQQFTFLTFIDPYQHLYLITHNTAHAFLRLQWLVDLNISFIKNSKNTAQQKRLAKKLNINQHIEIAKETLKKLMLIEHPIKSKLKVKIATFQLLRLIEENPFRLLKKERIFLRFRPLLFNTHAKTFTYMLKIILHYSIKISQLLKYLLFKPQ